MESERNLDRSLYTRLQESHESLTSSYTLLQNNYTASTTALDDRDALLESARVQHEAMVQQLEDAQERERLVQAELGRVLGGLRRVDEVFGGVVEEGLVSVCIYFF
jgi:hypothetical protein